MATLKLQRNVQFLYEEHLARIELQAFGCHTAERDPENPWQMDANLNGSTAAVLSRSAYLSSVDGAATTYSELILPAYQGGDFNRTRSVNQYLTHWIYPYRGKFHPQMVRALLNILGIGPGAWVLEPFSGSGTTALEAILLGANCIGIDRSPVCVLVGRVKTQAYTAAELIRERVAVLLENRNLLPSDVVPIQEEDHRVTDFLDVAKLVTASDVERRNRDAGTSFRRNLKQMLESVEAQARAIARFEIQAGVAHIVQGDARNLEPAGVLNDSIDGVVTSPPYSVALDYVENDEHSLRALGANLAALRADMIGVRGRNTDEKMAAYVADMKLQFQELSRVLKPGAAAAYVIGDATVGGSEVATTREMIDWAADAGLTLERDIPKIVFGLYNVMQDERILIFRKP